MSDKKQNRKMKALSIKQPWAGLIASGLKDIENRSWRTNFRGRIYIHASSPVFKPLRMRLFRQYVGKEQWDTICKAKPEPDYHQFGAIIGEVDIVDCVDNHPSIWAEKGYYPINHPDTPVEEIKRYKHVWNWVLANPVMYNEPILGVKGKLSFWEYEPVKIKL